MENLAQNLARLLRTSCYTTRSILEALANCSKLRIEFIQSLFASTMETSRLRDGTQRAMAITEGQGTTLHVKQDSNGGSGTFEVFQKLEVDLQRSLRRISQKVDEIQRQRQFWPSFLSSSAPKNAINDDIIETHLICEHLINEAASLKQQIERLQMQNVQQHQDRQKIEQLQSDNPQPYQDKQHIQKLKTENLQLNEDIASLKKSQQQLMEKNRMYQDEGTKLRQMMTSPAEEKGDPLDQDIQQRVQYLKIMVQSIVHKHFQMSGDPSSTRTPIQRKLYDSYWRECKDEGSRQRQLRSAMWGILYECIFSKPLFGIGNPFHDVLGRLESSFQSAQVDILRVAEWRRSTFQCIQLLKRSREQSDPLKVPIGVSKILLELFEPLILEKRDKTVVQRLQSDIQKLCNEAYRFTLELRRSKSTFTWENPRPGQIVPSAMEHDCGISVMHFDDGGTDEDIVGSRISYTLFGAVIKKHWKYENKTIIIPAEVVCIKAPKEI